MSYFWQMTLLVKLGEKHVQHVALHVVPLLRKPVGHVEPQGLIVPLVGIGLQMTWFQVVEQLPQEISQFLWAT